MELLIFCFIVAPRVYTLSNIIIRLRPKMTKRSRHRNNTFSKLYTLHKSLDKLKLRAVKYLWNKPLQKLTSPSQSLKIHISPKITKVRAVNLISHSIDPNSFKS